MGMIFHYHGSLHFYNFLSPALAIWSALLWGGGISSSIFIFIFSIIAEF